MPTDKNGAMIVGDSHDVDAAFNELLNVLRSKSYISNRDLEENIIIRNLDKIIAEKKYVTKVNPGYIFYRARCVNHTDYVGKGIEFKDGLLTGFDEYESKEPPIFLAGNGRCNPENISYLYVADDVDTACMEVRPLLGEVISVARFASRDDLDFFDLTKEEPDVRCKLSEIFDVWNMIDVMEDIKYSFGREFRVDNKVNKYIVAQYLADYIRKVGFDGITYKSSMSGGKNYVIFHSHKSKISFVSSELYFHETRKSVFINLNTQAEHGKETKWKHSCEEIRNDIIDKINKKKNS